MKLAPWALLCVLAWAFPGLARARVVAPEESGFAECNAFFLAQTPPKGFPGPPSHVKICQKYKSEPRFATLYSTRDKAPLYSAFKYTEAAPSGEESWLVEPQIDDPKNGQEGMMPEAEITDLVKNLGKNQALAADYVDSSYKRVCLNPSSLHKDQDQTATQTLTNAVPVPPDVQETWDSEVSSLVSHALAPNCQKGQDLYLISGAIPSSVKVGAKVSVPEALWLAACCDDGSKTWSLAFLKPVAAGSCLENMTLEVLQKKLPAGTQLFKDECGKERNDPKALEAVEESVKEVEDQEKGKEQEQDSSSEEPTEPKEEGGFLENLWNFFIKPIWKLVKYIFSFIYGVCKMILSVMWEVIKKLFEAVKTFLKGITSVLVGIFVNLVQVIVTILNGIAANIHSVLMLVYRIICVPLHLIVDIISVPFYALGAIPDVLKDIGTGLCKALLLFFNAISGFFKGLSYIASYLAGFLPKMSPDL